MIKKTLSKGLLVLGLLAVVQTATAEIADFACPVASSLQFAQPFTQKGSEFYHVSGETKVLKGDADPFEMYGTTTANSAHSFIGAVFKRDYLTCEYTGSVPTAQVEFKLKNYPTFGLEYCYFPNGNGNQCEGGNDRCRLTCEML